MLEFKPMPGLFEDMPLWGAKTPSFTFVISKDGGFFQASAKSRINPAPWDGTTRVIGEAFSTFDAAKAACEAFAKEVT